MRKWREFWESNYTTGAYGKSNIFVIQKNCTEMLEVQKVILRKAKTI